MGTQQRPCLLPSAQSRGVSRPSSSKLSHPTSDSVGLDFAVLLPKQGLGWAGLDYERTLDRPLEGREGGLDGVAAIAGRVPGVAVLVDELVTGLGQEGALMVVLAVGFDIERNPRRR